MRSIVVGRERAMESAVLWKAAMRPAPFHRTWKTAAKTRRRFPQLPQPLLPEKEIENQEAKPQTNRHMLCKGRTRSIL